MSKATVSPPTVPLGLSDIITDVTVTDSGGLLLHRGGGDTTRIGWGVYVQDGRETYTFTASDPEATAFLRSLTPRQRGQLDVHLEEVARTIPEDRSDWWKVLVAIAATVVLGGAAVWFTANMMMHQAGGILGGLT